MKMISVTLSVVMITASVFLTGCASLNSDFECKLQPGVKCKSVDEVNALVDEGHFDKNKNDVQKNSDDHFSYFAKPASSNQTLNEQIHVSEKPLPIWIAPFADEQGNYHEAHRVYTMIKLAPWTIQQ